MRPIAIFISLAGLLLLGGALVLSFVSPITVERMAREVIKAEVQKRVDERIDALDDSTIGRLAGRFVRRNQEQLATVRQQIADGLPQRIATEIGRMLDADCECRRIIGKKVEDVFAGTLASLGSINDRLTALVQSKYAEVTGLLMREFRIFTGANALVFAALGVVTLARPKANLHLVLPSLVLLGGAALAAYFYLFHQDWLHTIVFSDYVGWWYFPWLAFAIGWLADILLNHGRVTVRVIDGLVSGIANGVSIGPC